MKKTIITMGAYILILTLTMCSCKNTDRALNLEIPAEPEASPVYSENIPEKADTVPPEETQKQMIAQPLRDSAWTKAEIMEYLDSGRVNDTLTFKFGDLREDVEAELGKQTEEHEDDMDLYMYGWIGVKYYPYEYQNLSQHLTLIVFFEGERFFGLEVGKATIDDVKSIMGLPSLDPLMEEGYDYSGFSVFSPGEPDDDFPPPGEKYYYINCLIRGTETVTLIFYFTDGILETVAIYDNYY